MFIYLITT